MENYIDQAERVIKDLPPRQHSNQNKRQRNRRPGSKHHDDKNTNFISSTQIRKFLSMTLDVDAKIKMDEKKREKGTNDELSIEMCDEISYLRMRFAYQGGREDKVKDFLEKSKLLESLKDIGNSKKKWNIFLRYVESLVGFHKFYYGEQK